MTDPDTAAGQPAPIPPLFYFRAELAAADPKTIVHVLGLLLKRLHLGEFVNVAYDDSSGANLYGEIAFADERLEPPVLSPELFRVAEDLAGWCEDDYLSAGRLVEYVLRELDTAELLRLLGRELPALEADTLLNRLENEVRPLADKFGADYDLEVHVLRPGRRAQRAAEA